MIKVYFESNQHAEVVATFEDEELYTLCLPVLEAEAKKARMIVTESDIDDEDGGCNNRCEDCENMFLSTEGRPYKYEPEVWLCDDCEDQRMEEN